jgi:hypothetical protein
MQNIKEMPHKYSMHAIKRLAERVEIDVEEADHYFDMAKIVKMPGKDGSSGTLECSFGDCKICFECSIHEVTLWISTIKVYPSK